MARKTRNHKRRRNKRKTLKKNKRTKRYTRKKRQVKKEGYNLATRIQRIDGYIKATMDDLQKHKRSKSVAFPGGLLDNTYLLANIKGILKNHLL